MNAAAANEDVYDEIWKLDNEPYILEVSADGRIKSRVNSSLDHTILEFGANMGIMDLKGNHIEGETLIKYTGNGADHWLIAWKEDHAYIYLANKDESMIWEVSPNIDKEYY